MATTAIIPIHVNKGKSLATTLKYSVKYIKNLEKTNSGEWVTSYECDPLIADKEFNFSKNQYAAITGRNQGANDVIAYHLRISFKPGETDAETANRIGYELAHKLTKGNHAFVCCTHTDKHHIHTHIVINSISLDCTRKFHNFKGSTFAVRKIADNLCLQNGLSIVEEPKPSKGKNYGRWQGKDKPPTNIEKLEQMIDSVLPVCKNIDDFISAIKSLGCEVKRGKHISIKIPDAKKSIRLKSLGEDYSEEALLERILGKRVVTPKQKIETPAPTHRPSLLIDIQAKIQLAHSPGFEHYARLYNLKEMARTLIFLKERGIETYDDLTDKIKSTDSDFSDKASRIKEIETRQKEISELQRHIGTYDKTKNTYATYQKLKKEQQSAFQKFIKAEHPAHVFYEANRADIALCQAAKYYFNEQGFGKNKKIPTIKMLQTEYAKLESEKRKLYVGYKPTREDVISLKMAKQNIDIFLAEPRQPTKKRTHEISM